MPSSAAPRVGRAAVAESLEPRRLLTAYYLSTDADVAYVNTINLTAGDEVLLRGGTTFQSWLQFDARDRGTARNPIRVGSFDPATSAMLAPDADPSERATIDSGNGVGIWIQNTAGIEITGLNLVGSGSTSNTASGIYASNALPGNRKLMHLYIDHVEVSGYGLAGIMVAGSAGKSGFSDVRITNSEVHDNAMAGVLVYGTSRPGAAGYSHRNVYIGQVNAHDNTGIAGYATNTGSGIIVGGVNGATVEGCTASYNGQLNTAVGGPVGIWAYDSNRVLFQYNESHHNQTNSSADGGGFDFDGGVTNSVMQYNYSHDNDGAGFGLYQYTGARAWRNNVVRYNTSQNDGRANGYGAFDLWSAGTRLFRADIYGNTVSTDSTGVDAQPWVVRIGAGAMAAVRFHDNTFTAVSDAGLIHADSALLRNAVWFQNNRYAADNFTISWGPSAFNSLTTWQDFDAQELLPNGTRVGTEAPAPTRAV